MKKLMPILTMLLIAAFVLAACQPAATATPAPVEPTKAAEPTQAPEPTKAPEPTATEAPKAVKITIWHQWDGAYLDAITAAFKDYEAAHPGVTIDLSKPEDVANALNVAIPAGEGPDIIGWANDKIGEQALKGNIVDLDSLGVTMDFLKSTYEPAAVNGVVWTGKIWALPESQEGIALIYNKDIVTDKYLPTDPMNFDDLLAKAEQFQKDTGKVLVCNQGFGGSDAYHVAPIYFGFGVPGYVDDTGKSYVGTPEMVKGGEFLAKLAKFSLTENTYDICKAALKEGKVGMWWTGPWAVAGVEADKINYGIIPMGKPFVGIKSMMITKNAVDRGTAEVALDIVKYFTSAEAQKKIALVNKTIPAATAALNDPEVQKLAAVIGFGKALNLGIPMANTPYASVQWGPVGDASVAIWTGKQTPQEALDAANKVVEQKISEMQ